MGRGAAGYGAAGLLHARLGRSLLLAGRRDAALVAFELVPPEPPSPERAQVLAALGNALMLTWRHDRSQAICEQALALARAVGDRRAEFRALFVLGVDLAYLGHADDGLAAFREGSRRTAYPTIWSGRTCVSPTR